MKTVDLAIILGTVLLVPLGAQATMPASASSMEAVGGLTVDGDVAAMVLRAGNGLAIESIQATADSAHLVQWSRQGAYVACVGTTCPRQSVPTDAQPEQIPPSPARDVDLRLLGADGTHQLAILPALNTSFHFEGSHMASQAMEAACMAEEGFIDASANCPGYDETQAGFTRLPVAGPLQLLNTTHAHVVIVRGDLILELEGIALHEGELVFDTRQQGSGGAAGTYEYRFGRLTLLDATMQIRFSRGMPVAWAAESTQLLAQDGIVSLRAAQGIIGLGNDARQLDGDETIAGDFLLSSRAEGQALTFDVERRNPDGSPLAAVATSAGTPGAAAWIAAALLATAPALGVALAVRRHQAHASMQDVERALQRGRYGRADRLSSRIIRNDPQHESAHLSRAIAKTGAGRPHEAVAGVQAYLGQHQPGDGTLHYVLGLALIDLDRHDEARQALQEAVERTPALAAGLPAALLPTQDGAYT